MKAAIVAFAVALGIAGAASAQTWRSIDQRQADLNQRIDAGVQEGQITREEAARLRDDFRQIQALEQSYRVNGLNAQERRELDRRFDALSDQVRAERHDREANLQGATLSAEARMAMARQRISEGEQGGALTGLESLRLRAEAEDIGATQARLSAGGFTQVERAELDRRFDALDDKIRRGETTQIGYATAGDRR